MEFTIPGWRGCSFSAAKYFDRLSSRSLAQSDAWCCDSPLGMSALCASTPCAPRAKTGSIGQPQPSQGESSPAQTPEMGQGQGKKALSHSCLKIGDGWMSRQAQPPLSQRIPHSQVPPDCTSGCLISHERVFLNEETTRKVGGRTHSSINQENKNLQRNLESSFLSQPMWQGGIDLSNLLSVTMKLYFPLNSPTNVTDG